MQYQGITLNIAGIAHEKKKIFNKGFDILHSNVFLKTKNVYKMRAMDTEIQLRQSWTKSVKLAGYLSLSLKGNEGS